jgi:class 3 adenylate cyclase/predicted ATPase
MIMAPGTVWTAIMDVGDWLRGLELGQYLALFREHEIDAEVLHELTDADLEKFGVPFGHRRRLLKAIEKLATSAREQPGAAPTPPVVPPGASAERRHVTVMFCDLVGSTTISAGLDAEDWRNLVSAYLDAASEAVAQMGGHVAKKLGDGIMAVFGQPIAQENDSERAIRAALAIQRSLTELNLKGQGSGAPELVARIGIAAGAVVVDSTGEIFGDAPNVAARVQALAEPGTVLVTGAVQRQVAGLFVVEDRGAHELKGLREPRMLFRIVRASGGGRRSGQKALTPFVGREEETAMLLRRWERARRGEGQFVMIVGEPGLGKSRLIDESHARLRETVYTWTEWSSSQLLQNTPLHPVAEWGRKRFGGPEVAPERRLADLEIALRQVKLDPAQYAPLFAPLMDISLPPERASALAPDESRGRQLAGIIAWVLAGARAQPAVLAIEDLHWADPTTLDVLRVLAERGAQAPLLIVATTRPEFRASWNARSHHGVLTLAPLDRGQVRQMVGKLASRYALSNEVIERVSDRTGGVPLFVEELTRLILESGEHGDEPAIPPTLQQSLTARLDRLGPAREVAMIGAVLGRDFSYSLLQKVAGQDESSLRQALDRLAEADFLQAEGVPPDAEYRFKHALTQDAAYQNLLKSRRQALHRGAAEALLSHFPDRATAQPEALAHHFTQAGLTRQAIEWWGRAGDQALRRSAFQEAIVHLGKAIEMADKAGEKDTTSQRLKLQTNYGMALTYSRGVGAEETRAAAARARQLAAEVNDPTAKVDVYRVQFLGALLAGQLESARMIAEACLTEARIVGAPPDIASANCMLGHVRLTQGVLGDARMHLEEGLEIYDSAMDTGLASGRTLDSRIYGRVILASACWVSGEVDRARELITEAKARADQSGQNLALGMTYSWSAILEAFRGDLEATRRDAETLLEVAAKLGLPLYFGMAKIYRGWARARLGDGESGAEEIRQGLAQHDEMKTLLGMPFFRTLLTEVEAEAEGVAVSSTQIDEALTLSGQTGQAWTDAALHRIRGDIQLKADPGNPVPAEVAYLASIAIAREQGARSFGLQAALKLAKLYQSTGRPLEAHDILAPALEGFLPTPEMPEIAEAQAMLAALAAMKEAKGRAC